MKIETLVILGVLVAVGYRVYVWIADSPRTPDPWGPEIEDGLERAIPLCHHCLSPQEHSGWFCLDCGAAIGPYCNYLPAVYPFALGDSARAGIEHFVGHRPLLIAGHALVALAFLPTILAPIYWCLLFQRLAPRPNAEMNHDQGLFN
jgi:hypothetical protein